MIDQNNALTLQLQDVIDKNLSNGRSSILYLVEINNLPALLKVYGEEFLNNVIEEVKDGIKELFKDKAKVGCTKDKYIYVIIGDTTPNEVEHYAKAIYEFTQLFSCKKNDNQQFHLVALISCVVLPQDSQNAEDALRKAFITMKVANKYWMATKHCVAYSDLEKSKEDFRKQLILTSCLKNALLEKKLRLAFQPIVESKTGAISHYEGLLRMINSEGKIVSAGPFIPFAEQMGFISFIDELVLEMIVEELKSSPNLTLAFNLSALGIYNTSWLGKTKKLLGDPDLASRIIVEITETAAHKDLSKAAYFVATLQDMGCQVALDDFGAGYTSFRQLKALSVDIIKIDGAFIRDILDHSDNLIFVKTLLNMSRGFGLKSVAEFVENGEIAKLLIELEVDYMQGNYFCPAVNYRAWVKENS